MVRKFSLFLVSAIAMSLLVICALPALAQTQVAPASDTVVNMGGFFDALSPLLLNLAGVVITFLVAWLTARITKLTGIQIEGKHREALQSALENGVNYGLNQLGRFTGSYDIDVKNKIVAEGIRYVQRSVPDALAHFNLTPERLKELLEAKLPKQATVLNV